MDNIDLKFLKSREIKDLQKTISEDDFLEALIIYIEVSKNMIGEYLEIKNGTN